MRFKIQTLNNISIKGLERLPRERFEVASEINNPDAILVLVGDGDRRAATGWVACGNATPQGPRHVHGQEQAEPAPGRTVGLAWRRTSPCPALIAPRSSPFWRGPGQGRPSSTCWICSRRTSLPAAGPTDSSISPRLVP